jgi:hypothetical protein
MPNGEKSETSMRISNSDESRRPIPNFFIVGAARSGTTSIWEWLSRHPDVYMSYQKEPCYFGSDLTKAPNEFAVLEKEAYFDLFKNFGHKPIRGESSVLYLISKNAAREIYEFNPAAKILIILRNPVDMLHSYHGQLHWVGHEDIEGFEEAMDAEPARRQGLRVPKSAIVPEALYYSEVAKFAEQVERYLLAFPRPQVKIMLYEDLAASPQTIYDSLQDFLGIRRVALHNSAAKNAYKKPRSIAFAAMVQRPPRLARFFLDFIPQPYRHIMLVKSLLVLNTRRGGKEPMRPATRQRLNEFFVEDVVKLGRLIGRDLSQWLIDKSSADEGRSGAKR